MPRGRNHCKNIAHIPAGISAGWHRGVETDKTQRKQVRVLLKSMGIALRTVGTIPAKADPEAQKSFINEELEPLLEPGVPVTLVLDKARCQKCKIVWVLA
jgi:methyl coenzyme M reductase subunit D